MKTRVSTTAVARCDRDADAAAVVPDNVVDEEEVRGERIDGVADGEISTCIVFHQPIDPAPFHVRTLMVLKIRIGAAAASRLEGEGAFRCGHVTDVEDEALERTLDVAWFSGTHTT